MDILPSDLLLYTCEWLDIKETLGLFATSKHYYNITKERKFWLLILKKFWHDTDLTTVSDENIKKETIKIFKEYCQGTHLTLYQNKIPYELMEYVCGTVHSTKNVLVVLSKGPGNDGMCKSVRILENENYFVTSEGKNISNIHKIGNEININKSILNFKNVQLKAKMFKDFSFPYLVVKQWSLGIIITPPNEYFLVFKCKSIVPFYFSGKEVVTVDEEIEVTLIPGRCIGQHVRLFWLNMKNYLCVSIYSDRPMNLCLIENAGFNCM